MYGLGLDLLVGWNGGGRSICDGSWTILSQLVCRNVVVSLILGGEKVSSGADKTFENAVMVTWASTFAGLAACAFTAFGGLKLFGVD